MLKPAQLYKEKLQKENISSWYRPENIFWHGGTAESTIQLPDNNGDRHCFVSVDSNDEVIGYIAYSVDWTAMTAYGFGIISFKKGSVLFAKDVYRAVCDCFEVYHLNRVEWSCYADNPAIRGYRNFIRRYGGRQCGYYRQIAKLKDGRLHDSISFEILAAEFQKKGSDEAGTSSLFSRLRSRLLDDKPLYDAFTASIESALKDLPEGHTYTHDAALAIADRIIGKELGDRIDG